MIDTNYKDDNNISNDFNNNRKNNPFRIYEIIPTSKKNRFEINNQYDENRFLNEKDIKTCLAKNCNYMKNQEFIKPHMRKI